MIEFVEFLCLERLPDLVPQPCGTCVNIAWRHTSKDFTWLNFFSYPSSVLYHVATRRWLHFSLCAAGQWLTPVQRLLRPSPVSFDYGAHCVCRLCVAQSACACWFVAYCKFEFRFRIGGMLSSLDDAENLDAAASSGVSGGRQESLPSDRAYSSAE